MGRNVFAELGLPHPGQKLVKAQLTLNIYRLIRQLGITQAEAGKVPRDQATSRLSVDAQSRGIILRRTPDGVSHRSRPGR